MSGFNFEKPKISPSRENKPAIQVHINIVRDRLKFKGCFQSVDQPILSPVPPESRENMLRQRALSKKKYGPQGPTTWKTRLSQPFPVSARKEVRLNHPYARQCKMLNDGKSVERLLGRQR